MNNINNIPLNGFFLLFFFSFCLCFEILQKEEIDSVKTSNGGMGEVIVCKDGHCSGTMQKTVSRVSKKLHHWLPSIHEDYYGPRSHRPKHH